MNRLRPDNHLDLQNSQEDSEQHWKRWPAANGRALPELVEPGVNGYLFQPVQPEDAARKMNQLMGEPEKWSGMGQASLERRQGHSLQNTIMHYEEQFRMEAEKIRVAERKVNVANKVSQKSLQ